MYGKPGWQRAEDDIVLCFVCFMYSYVHVCECVFIYDYFHFNIYSLTLQTCRSTLGIMESGRVPLHSLCRNSSQFGRPHFSSEKC